MKKLDSFFDTYEKRTLFVYLIYLICSTIFALVQLFLGFHLIQTNTYEQTFSLVNEWTVQHAFFGRCALNFLNMPVLNVTDYLVQTIMMLHLYEIIHFVGNLLCLLTEKRNEALYSLLCLTAVFIVMIIVFLIAFSSGTFYGAISCIRYIGIMLVIAYLLLLFILTPSLYRCLCDYHEALKTKVIIIE